MSKNGDILTAREAADLFGIHVESIRRLARNGRIPSYKMGKDWRFNKSALLAWTQTHHLRKQSASLLVIDDDGAFRKLLKTILEREGYRVHVASNGLEGIAALDKDPVDLVLLDLRMPRMDGPTFLHQLRERKIDIAVIVVTGYPDGDLMMQAMRYGTLTLLAKPVSQRQLVEAVGRTLKGLNKGWI